MTRVCEGDEPQTPGRRVEQPLFEVGSGGTGGSCGILSFPNLPWLPTCPQPALRLA